MDVQERRELVKKAEAHNPREYVRAIMFPENEDDLIAKLQAVIAGPAYEVPDMEAKTKDVRRLFDELYNSEAEAVYFLAWKAQSQITSSKQVTPEDAWRACTVFHAYQERWIDPSILPPKNGQIVVFAWEWESGQVQYSAGEFDALGFHIGNGEISAGPISPSDVLAYKVLVPPKLEKRDQPEAGPGITE